MITRKQLKEARRAAARLDRAAKIAMTAHTDLKATFPEGYPRVDGGMLEESARMADETRASARSFQTCLRIFEALADYRPGE